MEKCWRYLAEFYYFTTPDTSPTTRPFLEKARNYLEDGMKLGRGFHALDYPRVLMLLGEEERVVEQAFEQISMGLDSGPKMKLLIHQGLFYERTRWIDSARHCYKTVVGLDSPRTLRVLGENGIVRCRQGHNM